MFILFHLTIAFQKNIDKMMYIKIDSYRAFKHVLH